MIIIHLSRIMGEKRISQTELSQLTGIRKATVNEWYHGIVERLNVDHMDRICEALGCDIPELIEYRPNAIKRTGKHLVRDTVPKKGSEE